MCIVKTTGTDKRRFLNGVETIEIGFEGMREVVFVMTN
jgi:hypothetical protein